MSVFTYSYEDAANNFSDNRHSRWSAPEGKDDGKRLMTDRLGGIFRPAIDFHTKISKRASLFTIGSCFARGLERAAHKAGMDAKSLKKRPFIGEDIKAGFVNRYNTSTILNELRWASGESEYDDANFLETTPGRYIDAHAHPIAAAVSLDNAKAMRDALNAYFAHALSVDVVTITLGLIECWFDTHTQKILNIHPLYGRNDNQGRKLLGGDRFEFRVMSHDENMANLEDIYTLLKSHNPNVQIIISVSPVPLAATFSHRDVAVANMLSKSMLRSCAETWVGLHPDIQYFPSYEMAVLSDPSLVFTEDKTHIQQPFVDEIMAHFINNCVSASSQS